MGELDALHNVTVLLPASPARVYAAWLDSEEHGAMTRAEASIQPVVGRGFRLWDGYITGTNLELEPGRRIVQSWRTTDFPPGAPDSRLEVRLEPEGGGTRVVLEHTNLPEGQGQRYFEGWAEFYFQPMHDYFAAPAQTPAERPEQGARNVRKKTAGKPKAAKKAAKAVAKKAVAKKAIATTARKAIARKAPTTKAAEAAGKARKMPAKKAVKKAPAKKAAKKAPAKKAAKKTAKKAKK